MSPTSFEVMNAVHDWRQGEIRQNGSYIYADRIRVRTSDDIILKESIFTFRFSIYRLKRLLCMMLYVYLSVHFVNLIA